VSSDSAGRDLPFDPEAARAAAQSVLDLSGADDVEVLLTGSTIGLTRYAGSQIIQNTVQTSARAYVRVVLGQAVASASTNQMDAGHLARAATKALEAAHAAPSDPEFPGLPDPAQVGRTESLWRWDDDTAYSPPSDRAAQVAKILDRARGVEAAGIYETSAHCFGVVSSKGVDCLDGYTRCVASCLADNGEATGWGEASSHRAAEVDAEAVAARALGKAVRWSSQQQMPAGTYEVVLEPHAVAILLEYLAYSGFGAKQVIEGESFLATQGGQSVAAPSVTVADDATYPGSVGIGFDFEGVPRKRVAVIESGAATGPVSDLRTARRLGIELTGHGSGSNELGPFAANVVMEPGTSTLDELISGVADGVLVTRFHYVNILDRPATLVTGMTRDGTFRIRDGEIAGPIRNFRFAHSILDALRSVKGVGRELEAFAPEFGSFGSTVAPAVHLGEFHFSSTTSH
jgi:PmbA protein